MIMCSWSLPLFHFDKVLGGKGDDPALNEGHEGGGRFDQG